MNGFFFSLLTSITQLNSSQANCLHVNVGAQKDHDRHLYTPFIFRSVTGVYLRLLLAVDYPLQMCINIHGLVRGCCHQQRIIKIYILSLSARFPEVKREASRVRNPISAAFICAQQRG